MNEYDSKFKLGDKVYTVSQTLIPQYKTCIDCEGSGSLLTKALSKILCPKCFNGRIISGHKYEYKVDDQDKIGKIKIELYEDATQNRTTYMLYKTGIGSGTIWDGDYLFATKEEAEQYIKLNTNKEESNNGFRTT